MSDIETTYRLIALSDRNNAGQTALTPDLANLVSGDLVRTNQRRHRAHGLNGPFWKAKDCPYGSYRCRSDSRRMDNWR